VKKWPKNPLDMIVKELKKEKYMGKIIADLGCGEGKLEIELKKHDPTKNIYSYDL
jgi:16S rRNA G1207 methylase RsmC